MKRSQSINISESRGVQLCDDQKEKKVQKVDGHDPPKMGTVLEKPTLD